MADEASEYRSEAADWREAAARAQNPQGGSDDERSPARTPAAAAAPAAADPQAWGRVVCSQPHLRNHGGSIPARLVAELGDGAACWWRA